MVVDMGNGRSSRRKDVSRPTVLSNPYVYIPDNFSSIQQVTLALREQGLESSNLIVAIDFTKSNEWTGEQSFGGRCLHTIGDKPNPYEQAIEIIGKTLAPFDEDNLIPCFGFGDVTTHDQEVFSFHRDHSPCHGFEEVLACYRKIAPRVQLSGPTSFAPIIDTAVSIVERTGGQFHVLLIIADGQVTGSNQETTSITLSVQHEKTIQSMINASSCPLSIVLVGVGDGPWNGMKMYDDDICDRRFDNFQFVNFTAIMSRKAANDSVKESAFALAALMEVPIQYKAFIELGILGRTKGDVKRVAPRPPPIHSRGQPIQRLSNKLVESNAALPYVVCPICLAKAGDLAFGCGHVTCRDCGLFLSICPYCHMKIIHRLKLYNG
ncbi:hypothetical protein Sjap_003675 [Stephania japonica]|uniref:RING-type domain-containing protein n=1 Tax=Stephania japonica TaxID=461633 RepID=A0AAP0KRV6_9MAGN